MPSDGSVVYVPKGTKQVYEKALKKFAFNLKNCRKVKQVEGENKMIELEKTYISSSMEAQIAEMMGRDEKSNDYRFYHLFSSLVLTKQRRN